MLTDMQIALGGHDLSDPGDPFWLVPPLADVQRFSALDQSRLEDLQVFAFLAAVAASGGLHPLDVTTPLSDPPDRVVRRGDREWAVELTELTVEDLRADLGRARAFGRSLQEGLEASGEHEHLRGRLVNVAPVAAELPSDPATSLPAVVAALKEDKGSISDIPIDPSQGLPEQLPDVGFYGDVGAFNIHLNAGPGIVGRILVSASTQAQIRRSEALESFQQRVASKDRPENEILVVTCGLPDKRGYMCAVDEWIFRLLREIAGDVGLPLDAPQYLTAVALHSFSTGEWFEAYRANDAEAPWSG
jgi:hypothetical protein